MQAFMILNNLLQNRYCMTEQLQIICTYLQPASMTWNHFNMELLVQTGYLNLVDEVVNGLHAGR